MDYEVSGQHPVVLEGERHELGAVFAADPHAPVIVMLLASGAIRPAAPAEVPEAPPIEGEED